MITVDLNIAKTIVHGIRRETREQEFAPLDREIQLQIPTTDLTAVEAQRQTIRDRYSAIQAAIDAASNEQELRTVLASFVNK